MKVTHAEAQRWREFLLKYNLELLTQPTMESGYVDGLRYQDTGEKLSQGHTNHGRDDE